MILISGMSLFLPRMRLSIGFPVFGCGPNAKRKSSALPGRGATAGFLEQEPRLGGIQNVFVTDWKGFGSR